MIYRWFRIFNLTEFNETELTSKSYTLELDGVGVKNILVTQGNLLSMTCDGVMLSVNLNEKNPFEFDDMAIYLDGANDVFLGFAVDET